MSFGEQHAAALVARDRKVIGRAMGDIVCHLVFDGTPLPRVFLGDLLEGYEHSIERLVKLSTDKDRKTSLLYEMPQVSFYGFIDKDGLDEDVAHIVARVRGEDCAVVSIRLRV